jgi:hypothetical protein
MTSDSISIHEQETITAFLKRIGEFAIIVIDKRVEDHLKQAYRLCYHAILTINYGAQISFINEDGEHQESLWGQFGEKAFHRVTESDTQKELFYLNMAMQQFIDNDSLHPTTKRSLQLSADQILHAYLILRVQL